MTYISQNKLAQYRKEHCVGMGCPILGRELSAPCVDHNHRTGMVRGVLSREGNVLLGKFENYLRKFCPDVPEEDYPKIAYNLGDYLERGDTKDLHPVGLKQLTSRFSRRPKGEQLHILEGLGVRPEGKTNRAERTKLYREAMKSNHQ